MAAQRDIATDEAAAILRWIGYLAHKVPEGPEKSCDLRAEHPSGVLWVEAKRDEVPKQEGTRLKEGQTLSWGTKVQVTRKVEKTIGDAMPQLKASAPADDLKLLWYYVPPPNDATRVTNIHCTLYGVRWFHLTKLPPHARCNQVPVFLAGRAAFQEHPDLAAVVVQASGSLKLCINPFFRNAAQIQSSRLWQVFEKMRAIFDVRFVVNLADRYVVDPLVAGSGEAAVVQHLEERYGVKAKPDEVLAQASAWPGNEMGSLPVVPGAQWGRQIYEFAEFLHQEALYIRRPDPDTTNRP